TRRATARGAARGGRVRVVDAGRAAADRIHGLVRGGSSVLQGRLVARTAKGPGRAASPRARAIAINPAGRPGSTAPHVPVDNSVAAPVVPSSLRHVAPPSRLSRRRRTPAP